MTSGMVNVRSASHCYGDDDDGILALSNVSLDIGEVEFVAVVGPSGCGKSTLLRLIAGLILASSGSVAVGGKRVTGPRSDVGLVFQAPTLLPWANVLANVIFPLKMVGEYGRGSDDHARELLALAGLDGFETRMPDQLSGGMQQRVAICRGLIREPKVLLMDEPFAALDALTREEMGRHLLNLWTLKPKAIVFVTHSVPEAVMLSDRVVVMSARPGRVIDEIPIDLPRPRTFEIEASDEFQSAAKRIRGHIYGSSAARQASQALVGGVASNA